MGKLSFRQFVELLLVRLESADAALGGGQFVDLRALAQELTVEVSDAWVWQAAEVMEEEGLAHTVRTMGGHAEALILGQGRLFLEDGGRSGILALYEANPGRFIRGEPAQEERSPSAVSDQSARNSQPDATQPVVFLSHAHEDKPLARQIARGLEGRGVHVWVDEVELRIGDSLIERISTAIAEGDFLIAIVSPASLDSSWCQRELALAASKGINERRVTVLPVRHGGVEMPSALTDRLWIDADEVHVDTLVERLARDIGRHRADFTAPLLEEGTNDARTPLEGPSTEESSNVDQPAVKSIDTAASASLQTKLAERLSEIDAVFGIRPLVVVAVAPTTASESRTFSRESGVRETLERPPFSRHDGWNLVTLDQPRLVRGVRLSVENGSRKQLDLFRDGTLLAFGAVPGFLAWNRRDRPDKLNSLALVEFVHDALLAYETIIDDLDPTPNEIQARLGLRHALTDREAPIYVPYGRVDRMDYELDLDTRTAPEDGVDVDVLTRVAPGRPHIDVGGTAHTLLCRLYNWFGFPDEAVPYTNDARTTIDIDQIRHHR